LNRDILYKRIISTIGVLLCCIPALLLSESFSSGIPDHLPQKSILKIGFIHTANGKAISLRDSVYKNYFGEQYSVNKLKYYVSNIRLAGKNMGGYYLMNAASENNDFQLSLQPGNYKSLEFLLGVDSLRNCSGAQTGALDPMNDMFWTWNSGYVMFKLEGNSPVSTSDLNRIEHHVGGYKGSNNVATKIRFDFTDDQLLELKAGSTTEILIEANLDHYWHGNSDIKISELPVCTTAGDQAKKIAANFQNIFSIKNIRILP
jgi:hypothetical protein